MLCFPDCFWSRRRPGSLAGGGSAQGVRFRENPSFQTFPEGGGGWERERASVATGQAASRVVRMLMRHQSPACGLRVHAPRTHCSHVLRTCPVGPSTGMSRHVLFCCTLSRACMCVFRLIRVMCCHLYVIYSHTKYKKSQSQSFWQKKVILV